MKISVSCLEIHEAIFFIRGPLEVLQLTLNIQWFLYLVSCPQF